MIEKKLVLEARMLSGWQRHKFMVLVGLAILIALLLVMVSLRLYSTSGAAQLDLSRPGYESVRAQAKRTNDFTAFPSSGELSEEALNTFRTLYGEQIKQATAVDAFGGDVMNDAALGLEVPPPQ